MNNLPKVEREAPWPEIEPATLLVAGPTPLPLRYHATRYHEDYSRRFYFNDQFQSMFES